MSNENFKLSKKELLNQIDKWIEKEHQFLYNEFLPKLTVDKEDLPKFEGFSNGRINGMKLLQNLIKSHS